jgi:chromosome segregation ATPase
VQRKRGALTRAHRSQARATHTRELQIASNEHLALTSKNREAMEEVMRLRGVLQLREKNFVERGAELEQKKEREKHLWTELSSLQKDAAAAKSELAVLSNSLDAAKAEIEALSKARDMWQTKASMAERGLEAAKSESAASFAANRSLHADLRDEVRRAVEDADEARRDAADARRQAERLGSELESARRLLQQYRALSHSVHDASTAVKPSDDAAGFGGSRGGGGVGGGGGWGGGIGGGGYDHSTEDLR